MSIEELEIKYSEVLNFQESKKDVEEELNLFDISDTIFNENVISNWYAFFFDTSQTHQLDDLFLISICELIESKGRKCPRMNECSTKREFQTKDKGFIDLVLYAGEDSDNDEGYESAIIIENKINASLTNNLVDYYGSIKAPEDNKIGVLLTLYPMDSGEDNFVNITHLELARQVRQNLSNYTLKKEQRYVLYLMDFLTTIEHITKTDEMNDEIRFCIKHGAKLSELIALKDNADSYVVKSIKKAIADSSIFEYKQKNKEYITISIKNTNLSLYIHHNELFNTDQYEVSIYLRSEKEVSTFNEVQKSVFEKTYKDIEFDWSKEGKQWLMICAKLYPNPTESEFENVGEYIFERVKEDYTELIKRFYS